MMLYKFDVNTISVSALYQVLSAHFINHSLILKKCMLPVIGLASAILLHTNTYDDLFFSELYCASAIMSCAIIFYIYILFNQIFITELDMYCTYNNSSNFNEIFSLLCGVLLHFFNSFIICSPLFSCIFVTFFKMFFSSNTC